MAGSSPKAPTPASDQAAAPTPGGAAADAPPDTSIDQARVLLQSIPVGFAGSLGPAAVVGWLLRNHVAHDRLLAWFGVLCLAHVGRIVVWILGREDVAAGRNGPLWLRWLRLSVLGLGLMWAGLPLILPAARPFDEMLVTAMILAVCGAGVAQQSSDGWSALLFMLPPALTMSARLLLSADPTLRTVGVLIFIYFAYLTLATYRIQSAFVELSRLHAEAAKLSMHDTLTGLPNRMALRQRLEDALERARRNGTEVAVGYMDLDDFKQVNDRLGHAAGDKLLREVARRWSARMRSNDVLARLGGDEFVMVIADIDPASAHEELAAVLQRIENAAAEPLRLTATRQVRIQLTMGVARFPADGADMDSLLRKADAAMYQLKQRKATRETWWQLGVSTSETLSVETDSRPATATD